MRLYANPTSPFVRVVRMALHEKGLAGDVELVRADAWADAPDFLDANPAARVPALVTDEGVRLTEAMLILHHLDSVRPEPAAMPRGLGAGKTLERAGVAINIFDAAVAMIIGRRVTPEFDEGIVGRKRFRTMRRGFVRLEEAGWQPVSRALDLADMAGITALDYAAFRFPDTDWRGIAPEVAAFRDANADRPSVSETAPRD